MTRPKPQRVAKSAREFAYVEVASSELTRDINRDIILERIRSMQPISRVDLARASGLQPSTVSSIVERLLEERWIRESAIVKTARGRRPTLLSLNEDMVLLVADIRATQAIAAVIDLHGRFLERQTVPLSRDPGRSIEAIATVMNNFRSLHLGKTFQGAGISVPGRIDPTTNRLLFAPNLPWTEFPIQQRLEELLELEVQLENSANASLLAELWFGRIGGIHNATLVTISEGIGAAIFADGRLIGGRNGLAGEFGHMSLDPDGTVCRCGARGCWEVYASSRAALQYYRELEPDSEMSSIKHLASLALDRDPSALAALDKQAQAIGQGLSMINAALSPDVILLAGDITNFYESVRERIEQECRRGAMDGVGPRVIPIGDGEVSRLRGAAAVVLQRHSEYYRAGHIRADPR